MLRFAYLNSVASYYQSAAALVRIREAQRRRAAKAPYPDALITWNSSDAQWDLAGAPLSRELGAYVGLSGYGVDNGFNGWAISPATSCSPYRIGTSPLRWPRLQGDGGTDVRRSTIAAIGGSVLLLLGGDGYAAAATPGAQVSAIIPLSVNPTGVGFADGSAWVTLDAAAVARIDPPPPTRSQRRSRSGTSRCVRSADSTRCG
jgi:hypothetical protein